MKNQNSTAQTLVLEPSTHPHTLASEQIEAKNLEACVVIKTKNGGVVSHGEHGTIATESDNIVKYVQQEYNPVTRAMQNAFD